MIAVNLLPPAYIHARLARRRCAGWSVATSVFGLLLACAAVGLGLGMQRDETDPAPKIGLLEGQIREKQRAVEQAKAKSRALTTRLAAARAVGVHPDYSVLLGLLAGLREGEITLASVAVASRVTTEALAAGPRSKAKPKETPHIELALTGLARSPAAVAAFVLRLEKTGLFASVSLTDTALAPPTEHRAVEATAFKVTARFTSGAPDLSTGTTPAKEQP